MGVGELKMQLLRTAWDTVKSFSRIWDADDLDSLTDCLPKHRRRIKMPANGPPFYPSRWSLSHNSQLHELKVSPRLSNPVTPIFSLQVVVRIVVNVMQNNRVCSRQVYAQPTGLSGQQENERVLLGVELVDEILPENWWKHFEHKMFTRKASDCIVGHKLHQTTVMNIGLVTSRGIIHIFMQHFLVEFVPLSLDLHQPVNNRSLSIQSEVLEPMVLHVKLHDVQHHRELWKQQHPVTLQKRFLTKNTCVRFCQKRTILPAKTPQRPLINGRNSQRWGRAVRKSSACTQRVQWGGVGVGGPGRLCIGCGAHWWEVHR